jgi:iron complex outermembrane receptor protein
LHAHLELALPFPPFFNVATNARRTVQTESMALFGELTYQVTDRLALIGGARYTDEEVSATYIRTSTPILSALPFNSFFGPDVSGTQSVSDTDFSGRLIARYSFGDAFTGYVTYSRGYKGVGIDVAESVNVDAITTPGGLQVLAPEIPTLYELGLKAEFLDRQLSVNSAFFHQTVEDLQAITNDDQGRTLNLSIDEVLSRGVEVDAYYNPSAVPGLSFAATLTYLDVSFEAFRERPDLVGEDFPDVPELSWSLIADHSFDVGSSGYSAFVRGEYYWQDEKNTALDGNPTRAQDAYGLLNLRTGLNSPGGRYSLTLSAENVTDEDYVSFVGGSSYSAIDGVTSTQFVGDPLLYRVMFAAEF